MFIVAPMQLNFMLRLLTANASGWHETVLDYMEESTLMVSLKFSGGRRNKFVMQELAYAAEMLITQSATPAVNLLFP